jgi:hypothetical protein
MSDNVRFHSKHHGKAHHTVATPGYIDSAKDPMASPGNEFMGNFHLSGCFVVYDTAVPNTSGTLCINEVNQVVSMYSTIQGNSAAWAQGSKWTDSNGHTYLTQLGDNVLMRTTTPVTTGLTVSGSIATYNEFLTSRDGGQTFVDIAQSFGNLYTFNVSPSAPTISEAFTGDGSTTLFESTCAIDTTSRILLNIGGVAQLPTTHYTISANPTRSNKADIKILPAVANDVSIEVRHFPSSNSPWSINDDSTIFYTQGNVGIGTQSPSKRLTIAGEVSASGALIVGGDLEIGRVASPWIDGGSSIYYSDGKVGIGTTAPETALTVLGAVSASDGFVTSKGSASIGRSTTYDYFGALQSSTGDLWCVRAGGTPGTTTGSLLTVLGTGNVGIGTTAPTKKLDVVGDIAFGANSYGLIEEDSTEVHFKSTTTGTVYLMTHDDEEEIGLHHTGTMTFKTAGDEAMRINVDGNVGIGTTAPLATLDVSTGGQNSAGGYNSQSAALNIIYEGGAGSGSEGQGIFFSQQYSTSDATSYVRTGAIVGQKDQADGSFGGGLKFKIQPTGATAMVDAMTIKMSGNVGIGTVAPAAKLHVDDSSTGAALRVGGTANTYAIIEGFDQYHQIIFRGYPSDATTGYSLAGGVTSFTEHGGEYRWYKKNGTTLAEQMRIDSDGKVGIGTTAPDELLTVAGSISARGTIYSDGSEVGGSSGKVLQVVSTTHTDIAATASGGSSDWTVTSYDVDITPSSTSSKILVTIAATVGTSNEDSTASIAIKRTTPSATLLGIGDADGSRQRIGSGAHSRDSSTSNVTVQYLDSPNTISECTYALAIRARNGYVTYINRSGSDANAQYRDRGATTITVMEIAGE